jgi:hypothetical protein
MKRIFLLFAMVFVATISLLAQPKQTIVFENNTHDLGTIVVSEKVYTVVYPFKNAGLLPLQIQIVSTPCVCTTASWTKDELQPGESGEITITYQANGPIDNLSLAFYVYSNGIPNPAALILKGKVKESKKKSSGN